MPDSICHLQINLSDKSSKKIIDLENQMTSLALDWKGNYIYFSSQNTLMTSYSIFRLGFIVENRKTVFVGKPSDVIGLEVNIQKIVVDPTHNSILYYTSQISSLETLQLSRVGTYQLSRVVMTYRGDVSDHQVLDFSEQDQCNGISRSGFLSEFTVKSDGQNSSTLFFVLASTYDLYSANVKDGLISGCNLVTKLGSAMVKDLSFSTSAFGDQVKKKSKDNLKFTC